MNPDYTPPAAPSLQPATHVPPPGLSQSHAAPPLGWLWEGGRSAFFLRPRWDSVRVGPWGVAAIMVVLLALLIGLQRMVIPGAGRFYWQSVSAGWLSMLVAAWACWLAARHAPAPRAEAYRHGRGTATTHPGPAALFGVLLAQGLALQIPLGLAAASLIRWGDPLAPGIGQWPVWASYGLLVGWPLLAAAWLLCRQAQGGLVRLTLLAVMAGSTALSVAAPGTFYWYADDTEDTSTDATEAANAARTEYERNRFVLTQEVMEAQTGALVNALDAVQPQRPGVVDLYAITFAPVATENVFSREARMVEGVMHDRFDATGRSVRLQNHAKTASTEPWATPLNLQRAIARMAERMDREEDVLFIHLTSHGGQNGQLAASFWPLEVAAVTPTQLKAWLDEAGVRNRVISISACYSGSWVAPLADERTLVMTAADATHTSYGCGRKSELTFFGRAMFDEQLRSHTRSFEAAHAAARPLIDQREKAAGKTDGYSNPQIRVGAQIRPVLEALEARLAASSAGSSGSASAPALAALIAKPAPVH